MNRKYKIQFLKDISSGKKSLPGLQKIDLSKYTSEELNRYLSIQRNYQRNKVELSQEDQEYLQHFAELQNERPANYGIVQQESK